MKTISQFDYIIVGGGLSGLHLSYSFQNDNYFVEIFGIYTDVH